MDWQSRSVFQIGDKEAGAAAVECIVLVSNLLRKNNTLLKYYNVLLS